jgi:transposase
MIDPIKAARQKRWDDIKQYFSDNDHLTPNEIAINLGLSPSTIRKWRKLAGLTGEYPFKDRPVAKSHVLPTEDDQHVWDCEEWFKEYYEDKQYGITSIAKIISRSPRLVRLRLDKYGIKVRSHSEAVRSSNPCSNVDWLMFHYATKKEYLAWAKKKGVEPDPDGGKEWSLKRCAEMAGVVPATIYNWLVRVNNEGSTINIRDLNESMAGRRNPFYGKKHSPEALEKMKEASRNALANLRAKASTKEDKT